MQKKKSKLSSNRVQKQFWSINSGFWRYVTKPQYRLAFNHFKHIRVQDIFDHLSDQIVYKNDVISGSIGRLNGLREEPAMYVFQLKNKKNFLHLEGCAMTDIGIICTNASFYYEVRDNEIDDLIAQLKRNAVFHSKANDARIHLLIKTHDGLDIQSFPIQNPKMDFESNYNEDFKDISKLIISRLSKKNEKGLVLLYGKPGTGKTTYLRHLTSIITDKTFIYIPSNMTNILSEPSFLSYMMKWPNSVLVLEDAENMLLKRGTDLVNNQSVSNILNFTDGLLADCLNIQVIATFNTDLTNIDDALLRKGRLIARYEFGYLNKNEVASFCLKNNLDQSKLDNTKNYTLSDLININEMDFGKEIKKIGFQ